MGMVLDRITAGIAVCGMGHLLAVLPDALAAEAPGLHRLPGDWVPPTPIVAIYRTPVERESRVERVLEALRSAVNELSGGSTQPG